MDGANFLGDYLKARRRLVSPEQAGIPRGSRRRVAGLRREELALLAGISPEYYLRLEQGRDRNPSDSVLEALAVVLHLDSDSSAYLRTLARAAPGRQLDSDRNQSHPDETERVPAGVVQVLDELPLPAFVQGRWMDVLASNALAKGLSPQYRPGVNLLRAVFLDPDDRVLHQDWDRATEEAVSGLRASVGSDLTHPRLITLVDELSHSSERFRVLWDRHDVRNKVGGTSLFLHPSLGALQLQHEKFIVTGAEHQLLVMYHAEPGSVSQEALGRLLAESAP